MTNSQSPRPEGAGSRILRALGLGSSSTPVTFALIGLCMVAYVADLVAPEVGNAAVFAPVIGAAQPWRFLAAAFMHSGIWHLLLNMYALALIGQGLERSLGRWRFLAVYLLSALAGNVCVLLLASPGDVSWVTGTVGASGAVFGLFGALLVLQRSFGADSSGLFAVIAINLAFGFMPGMNISWQAHVGGLVMGLLLSGAFVLTNKRLRARLEKADREIRSQAWQGSTQEDFAAQARELAARRAQILASVRRMAAVVDAVAVVLALALLVALAIWGYR